MQCIYINGEENFKAEVLDFEGICLVDFYADWCGPCKMLTPIMDQLAEDYWKDPVKIVKVNTDINPHLAEEFAIVSIPQVFLFKNGEKIEQLHGVNPKTVYSERLDLLVKELKKKANAATTE